MYSFVEDKRELKEIREVCEQIIKSIQSSWLKEYFTFQFNLIGSGGVKLVTRNGSDGEYDLDYNLIIQKDKKNLFSNPNGKAYDQLRPLQNESRFRCKHENFD